VRATSGAKLERFQANEKTLSANRADRVKFDAGNHDKLMIFSDKFCWVGTGIIFEKAGMYIMYA
jgi:hypothetical protein